jgi:flagellar motor switch protein FliG
MRNQDFVITAYGHDKTIDKIAVSSFERSENYGKPSGAVTYCDTINSLELKGDSWVCAKIIYENTQYGLDEFVPLSFSKLIIRLNNRAIQRIFRKLNSLELNTLLKTEDVAAKERIYSNLTKRAAQILKEDTERMGASRKEIEECQKKFIRIAKHLVDVGEISYDVNEV